MAKTKQVEPEIKSIEQLRAELASKRQDLLAARSGLAAGELANPRLIRALRKDIARLLTQLRARELEKEED